MPLLLALGQSWGCCYRRENTAQHCWPWDFPTHLYIPVQIYIHTHRPHNFMDLSDTKDWGGSWHWGWGRDMETGLKKKVQAVHIRGCERGTCHRVGSDHILQMCTIKLCWDCFPRNAPASHCLLTGSLSSLLIHNSETVNLNVVTGMQVWMSKNIRMAIRIYLWW